MTTTTLTATPTKLRDGSWGARIESTTVSAGAVVTVRTRSGKAWQARIARVVWSGNGVSICSTVSDAPAPSRSRGRHAHRCHTDGNCSSLCSPTGSCPCADGSWFSCC